VKAVAPGVCVVGGMLLCSHGTYVVCFGLLCLHRM
jgi:hypothetical protein